MDDFLTRDGLADASDDVMLDRPLRQKRPRRVAKKASSGSGKCSEPGCNTHPYFNYVGRSKGARCAQHKLPQQINVVQKRNRKGLCKVPWCIEKADHSIDSSGTLLYCGEHSGPHMVSTRSSARSPVVSARPVGPVMPSVRPVVSAAALKTIYEQHIIVIPDGIGVDMSLSEPPLPRPTPPSETDSKKRKIGRSYEPIDFTEYDRIMCDVGKDTIYR